MAISKILYMKDCGNHFPGKHLKVAIDYITEPEKTQNGMYIAGQNCQPDMAYEQMKLTKNKFGKTDKRQGYHLIISFEEGEVDAKTAFEVVGKIVKEYLGSDYEAIYAVHDNTDHIHGHIVFNSVSFRDGSKYHYKKGDWAKNIQPVTNRICAEYGLTTIQIKEDRAKPSDNYKEWNEYRDGRFVWSGMIKRDLDACIMQAPTFDSFLELLADKGYEIKRGKYLAIKPPGMSRYKRCKTLGEEYSEETIRERIRTEDLTSYIPSFKKEQARIVFYKVKRFKRSRFSGLLKKYFAKLYRTGQLKKRPFSQAWKYKDDIRKMHKLQEQYLFLNRYNIRSVVDLVSTADFLTDKKKEVSKEKSKVFKDRAKYNSLFRVLEDLNELKECESSFQTGDSFFFEEHIQWMRLVENLKKQGYSTEEVEKLKEHYRYEIARVRGLEKASFREVNLAKSILSEIAIESNDRQEEKEPPKVEEKKELKQPKR